jgi:hypothetical protein
MKRAWISGMAFMVVMAMSARADDVPPGDKDGSIVKVDVGAGRVFVRVGDDKEVAVNLKDIEFLRDRLRYRLAERREGNKIFVTGDDGKVTELSQIQPGGKVFYREKDGKITHIIVPTKP